MQVIFLYAAVVLIWGSTWIAISYQLGVVAEEVSIAYRFAIGAATLFLYAMLTRQQIRLPLRGYSMVIIQGLLLFSINYFFVYVTLFLNAYSSARRSKDDC
jgi:drug/metabolite transporter (DMT)-like permease